MADLRRLRDDPRYLAELVGMPRAPWQSPPLDRLWNLRLAGRQMGKTEDLVLTGVHRAIREPGTHVLAAAPAEIASRRMIGMARSFGRKFPMLAASFEEEQLGLLRFRNGSTLRAIPTSEASARGWTVDVLLLDECQLIPRSFVDAITPTVAARPGARIVAAGTAGVASGWWFDLCREAEFSSEHVRLHRWVSTLAGGDCHAPWLSATVIESARRSMSPSRFAAEFKAEFASGTDVVFPRELLERQTFDYTCETGSLRRLRPAARFSVGIDWGERSDRSAAVVAAFFAGSNTIGLPAVRRWREGTPIPDVVDEIAGSPAHYSAVFTERNGIGASSSQYVERAIRRRAPVAGGGERRGHAGSGNPLGPPRSPQPRPPSAGPRPFRTGVRAVFTTAPLKAAGVGFIRLGLEEDRLRIPATATELRAEMEHARSDLTASGVERIAAEVGHHDDLVIALMMALQPWPAPGARAEAWLLRLYQLADPRRPTPAVPPGVALPGQTVWRSINGSELTTPARSAEVLPEPPAVVEARERILRRKEMANG